ncbi:MAG: molybdenum cofactor guanylyltransferase [Alphaproteobacteria bacterium]|nr:molybdenum cofactor guanylyltransferase [Alphaproteobacteria bacterium]
MEKPAAVILAGGEGRRLGGVEKALIKIRGRRLIDLTVAHLKPQSDAIAISLRTEKPWTDEYGVPVLLDRPTAKVGPLGGVAAALYWAVSLTPCPSWVVTVPVDLPFLPDTLIERLTATDTDISVARSGDRAHYAVAAWRPHLVEHLTDTLKSGAIAISKFQSLHKVVEVEWPTDPIDPFFNINTPEDAAKAEQYLFDIE